VTIMALDLLFKQVLKCPETLIYFFFITWKIIVLKYQIM